MESGSLVILSESLVIGSLVILSAAKDLAQGKEMLHYAQHDTTESLVILSESLVILSGSLVILSGPLVILSESLVILSGSLVILSEAKDLSRWAARCFAEFPLSEANGPSMTLPALVVTLHYRPPPVTIRGTLSPCQSYSPVMLSAAKHLSLGKEPDPSLRSERSSPVMLSAAKHLFALRASPFAQFPLSEAHGFSMTIEVSSTRDTKRKQHEAPADEALLRLYHD